ncbi:MAG: thiol-disulfide oxidoreductase [Candidatus Melainabacteria bacterium]|nr:MAG: thiol-disulfide oxidoreductase [Candidatus Melainabacteria bacterium]
MEQEIQKKLSGKHLILYDGVCALCNGFNKFVLPRDKRDVFRFASLQSPFAREILDGFGRSASALNTIYVIANFGLPEQSLKERADAALFVLDQIGGLYSFSRVLRVFPRSLLDQIYNFIAKNRYRLFGKYETCLLPDATNAEKFIGV